MIRWIFIFAALFAASGVSAQQRSIAAGPSQKADGFRSQNGRRVTFVCPATTVQASARVWGSNPYTDDSNVCESAIHAGVLQAKQLGVVTVIVGGPQKEFKSSTRNGVTSNAYGSWPGSMSFDTTGAPGQVDWATTAQWLPPDFQAPLALVCPAQGAIAARIWGSDTYHQDSAICVAAVHAGVLTAANGGQVTLTPRAGTMTFAAVARNGVSSVAYRGVGGSYQLAATQAMIGPGPGLRAVTAQAPTAPPPGNPPVAQSSAFIGPAPIMQSATTAPPPATTAVTDSAANGNCGVAFANPCAVAVNAASIKLTWGSRAEANKYQVFRGDELLATIDAPAREFVDEGLAPGQTADYRVKAVRVTGTVNLSGSPSQLRRAGDPATPVAQNSPGDATIDRFAVLETSNSQSATTHTLAIPTNVTAQSIAGPKGRVRIAWAPVAGANGYLVYRNGNPLPVDAGAAASNSSTDTGVPLGRHRYQVEALFTTAKTRRTVHGEASAGVDSVVAFPQPTVPFLSKPGGPNDPQEIERHYRTRCGIATWLKIDECASLLAILDSESNFSTWDTFLGSWKKEWETADYFRDRLVLGRERQVNCAPKRSTGSPVLCWAKSGGTILAPDPHMSNVSTPDSISVILSYPDGRSFFGVYESGHLTEAELATIEQQYGSGGKWQDAVDVATVKKSRILLSSAFDSQNKKPTPYACLSCHGGRYDPNSKMAIGASLLPLVPLQLGGDPYAMSHEMSRVNKIILTSNPAPAIVDQINSLETAYNDRTQYRGSFPLYAAIPAGWRSEPMIYRQVIEPYCASCHFAQRGELSFASAADVKAQRNAVQDAICNTFTMPHSEIQFRRFWAEGGLISLPGLLSTWLGFNHCGPLSPDSGK